MWTFEVLVALAFALACWSVAVGGLVAIWRDCRAERKVRRDA